MKNKILKIIFLIFLILVFILTPLIIYISIPSFQVKEFNDYIEIPYNTSYKNDVGNICYGNKIKCDKVKAKISGEVDSTKIGEYTVTYTYKYKNKSLVKKQTIKVIDNIAPTISVVSTSFDICPNTSEVHFEVTAFDEYDKDITSKVEQTIVNNQVIFKVSDSSGNIASMTKPVNFIDNVAPTITLNGEPQIYVKLNGNYVEEGAKAIDNCEGDITDRIEISGAVNTNQIGEYIVTYSVKDLVGNTSTITRKVYVYSQNNTGDKTIYLTFDDGPSMYTSKLLDVLKKYNVKATFFVTGQNSKYDDVILRAYNEGHTIGLHSDTHNYSIYQSVETYFDDLYKIQEKVKNITGVTSTIIRFPGGSSNTVSKSYDNGAKIMSTLTVEVEKRGFKYFDWNVSSGDAGGTSTTSGVVNNIINSLGNNSYYIVLQHDTKGFSVDAVEEVIMYALSKGYTFAPLTMTSPQATHKINN